MENLNSLYTLYRQGHITEVLAEGEILLDLGQSSAELYSIIGAANIAKGMLDRGLENLLKALEIEPNSAEIHNNLSVTLKKIGRLQEAETHGLKSLNLAPDFSPAYSNLGNVLIHLKRNKEALAHYIKALELQPDSANSHNDVGRGFRALGNNEQSISYFKQAIVIAPRYAAAHNNLGSALNSLGRHEEAVASYSSAIAINPKIAVFYNNIGTSYHQLGNFTDAIASYSTAIQLDPNYALAYRNLSEIKRYGEDDPNVKKMDDLLASPNCSNVDLMNIRFALGKANVDIGDFAKAFEHFYHGNRLRKAQLEYDIRVDETLFSDIKRLFSNSITPLDITPKPSDKTPIFVVGMPRSGTTLVEQILASHPLVHGAGELQLMHQRVASGKARLMPNLQELKSIRDSYLTGLRQLDSNKPYVVDKMPYNFLWIGYILTCLPEAKIVHLKRHAVATCWSNFKHCFSSAGNGFSYDLEDVAHYYKLYDELMLFWHQRFPGRILDFGYEALTHNQSYETKRLLEYVGLCWDDRCIDFHQTERTVSTASSRQVRQKLYQGSSEEWHSYEEHLQPMLNILNAPRNTL